MKAEADGQIVGGIDADPCRAHQSVKCPTGDAQERAELLQRHPEGESFQIDRSLERARGNAGAKIHGTPFPGMQLSRPEGVRLDLAFGARVTSITSLWARSVRPPTWESGSASLGAVDLCQRSPSVRGDPLRLEVAEGRASGARWLRWGGGEDRIAAGGSIALVSGASQPSSLWRRPGLGEAGRSRWVRLLAGPPEPLALGWARATHARRAPDGGRTPEGGNGARIEDYPPIDTNKFWGLQVSQSGPRKCAGPTRACR